MDQIIGSIVLQEARRAEERYGPFTSTHEALGVLVEEIDELCDAIRANDLSAIARESLQVSAVAMRLSDQCERASDAFRARSVK